MEHTCHGTGSQNTSGVDYWEYKPPINCSTEPLEYGHSISCKGAKCGRDVDNRNKKTLQKICGMVVLPLRPQSQSAADVEECVQSMMARDKHRQSHHEITHWFGKSHFQALR